MGIHIVIFLVIAGVLVLWKFGWIPEPKYMDKRGKKLFILVACTGNFLGMFITLQSGMSEMYTEGYKLEKTENGSYEQEFLVSVDEGEAKTFYVQVPEKEGMETEEEEKMEVLSEEEIREKNIRNAIALYNQEINDPDYYYLPSETDGMSLIWEKPAERTGSLFAALGLFAAVVLLLKNAREEQEKAAKRAEQMLLDYPSMIMKFTLLVQAGMTVRKAFQKIALDYKRRKTSKVQFVYEEILVTCNEMESGISEIEAYRRFGERCGQMKYKTFATLLIQNLQKGSKRLSDILEKESIEAWDERKRKARVQGEIAASKLLIPMILMMVVVMAIVMIPAFLAFYG